jgi:hypothetical protein
MHDCHDLTVSHFASIGVERHGLALQDDGALFIIECDISDAIIDGIP